MSEPHPVSWEYEAPKRGREIAKEARRLAEEARQRGEESRRRAELIRKISAAISEHGGQLLQQSPALYDDGDGSQASKAAIVAFRRSTAELTDKLAEVADGFAGYLEEAAGRGDLERRLRLAAVEREIARISRRNAEKLRETDTELSDLEPLPRLR